MIIIKDYFPIFIIYHYFFEFFDYLEIENSTFNTGFGSIAFTFFIFNENIASLSVHDCYFNQVSQTFSNVALATEAIGGNKIDIQDCVFEGFGTAINLNQLETTNISNCVFLGNMHSVNPADIDTLNVANCQFVNTRGIVLENGSGSSPSVINIDNSTFYNNMLEFESFNDSNEDKCWVNNCILDNNTLFYLSMMDTIFYQKMVPFQSDKVVLISSLLDAENCETASSAHITCSPTTLFATAPLFLDTAAHDYRLHPCSPARNAGSYNLTLTDAHGCTATASVIVAEHLAISVQDTVVDASGPAVADGSVLVSGISGGTGGGYVFSWNNGTMGQNLSNVPPGGYSLTVTDSQGCTAVFPFFVDFNSATHSAIANPFGAAIVPNPSGSGARARVQLSGLVNGLVFSVFDSAGKLVATGGLEGKTADLPTGLAAGSYRVVLEDSERWAVLNWVVE